MDGTLIDSMPAWRSLRPTLLAERGIAMTDALESELAGLTVHASAGVLARRLPELGMDEEALLAEFMARMSRFYAAAPEKPGARRFLAHLHAQRIPCAVLTATGHEMASAALRQQGMTPYLRFVQSTRDMGISKSDPDCFAQIAARLGVACGECAVFEDALYAVRGAHAAGCRVFAIADDTNRASWAEILSLAEAGFSDYGSLLAPGAPFPAERVR